MEATIEIYNDDDFTLIGPGVRYNPFSGRFKHKIQADNAEELYVKTATWLLSLEIREPYDTESTYNQYEVGAGHGFRIALYEAARHVIKGWPFSWGGNREIDVTFN